MNHSLTASSPVSKRLSPRKMAFITGTLLLTSTGFICRILGFFYRIFMSRTIGAEGLGIYNMVHPIFSICFAVCAGSIQTALSQYVAANQTRGRPYSGRVWSLPWACPFSWPGSSMEMPVSWQKSFCWNQDAPPICR